MANLNFRNLLRLPDRRRRHGTELVEAAIVMLLLITLVFAVIEYGWMFFKQQQITNATRQGARVGATPNSTNGQITSSISSNMSSAGLGSSGYTVTLTPSNVSTVTAGQTFTVKVSVSYSNIGITGMTLFPKPSTLSASMTMSKEGP